MERFSLAFDRNPHAGNADLATRPGALFAFVVMVLVPGLTIFLMAQKEFIRGLTSGATKG
jgi:ABC-type glycerol-3-phosphate transport system permease component